MNGPELIDQLRKLWILDLVVHHGCFHEAANLAKVTRSAVSQTITSLEKSHGKTLLIRERGSVRATSYCLEVLGKARPVLESLRCLKPARNEKGPLMSWLDLGAYESLAIEIMPALLQRLEEKCPGIRISVKVARSGKLATAVRKGELCMAIVVENDLLNGLTVIPIAEDRLGLFVSARLAPELQTMKATECLPIGTLSAAPDGHPNYYRKFLKELALPKQPSFTSDSFEAVLAATTYGSIVGILPARLATRRPGELVEITPSSLIQKGLGTHRIFLISRRDCDARENELLATEIRSLLFLPRHHPVRAPARRRRDPVSRASRA